MSIPFTTTRISTDNNISDNQRKRGQPKAVEVIRLKEILWRQGTSLSMLSAAEKRQIQFDYQRKLLIIGYFVLTKNSINAIAIKVCTNIGVYIGLPEGQPPLSQESICSRTVFKREIEQEIIKMANLRSNKMQNLLSKYDLDDREIHVEISAEREQLAALVSAVIEREMVYLAKSATYYAMEQQIKNQTGNTSIKIDSACLRKVIDHPVNLEERNTETSRLFETYLRVMFSVDHYDGKRKIVYTDKEKAGEIIFQFLVLMVHTAAQAILEKRYEQIAERTKQNTRVPYLTLEEKWEETKRYVLIKVQGARYTAEMAKYPEFGASEREKKEAAKILINDIKNPYKEPKLQTHSLMKSFPDASFLQSQNSSQRVATQVTCPQISTHYATEQKIQKRKMEMTWTQETITPNYSTSDQPLPSPPKYKNIIKKPKSETKPQPPSNAISNETPDQCILF